MLTNGRFYTVLTGNEFGNEKYSPELKSKIEEAGQLCLDNLKKEMSEKIQKATEKIQDYYDKSFAIQNSIGCTKKRKDVLDFIHEIRKTDKFPNDGGYSGAIILEKNEVGNLAGNENDQYQDIYVNSLRDMIKAYQYIK